jgi:hypothetical protein
MTATDHNRLIAFLHLGYAAFSVLLMAGFSLMFMTFFGVAIAQDTRGAGPPALAIGVMVAFMFVVYVAMAIPSALAGIFMLKQKKSAKVLGIIAAVLATMNFPFGTALCVYTLWFLFGEQGRALYDPPVTTAPPPPPIWQPGDEGAGNVA